MPIAPAPVRPASSRARRLTSRITIVPTRSRISKRCFVISICFSRSEVFSRAALMASHLSSTDLS
jgi:hypothetical protein